MYMYVEYLRLFYKAAINDVMMIICGHLNELYIKHNLMHMY